MIFRLDFLIVPIVCYFLYIATKIIIHALWAYKTSITPPLYIEVSVPSQDSERSCICVLEVSILPLFYDHSGAVMSVNVWQLDLQLPVQSVPITTKVVSSRPVHGEVYQIQHYVINFVSDLRQVGGFLLILRFPPPIKLTATI